MRTLRDEVVVDRAVPLRNRDGSEQAPIAVKEVASGGHHRQAEVVFPSIEGATQVRIVVRDIRGIPSWTRSRRADELPRLTAKTPVGSEITLTLLRAGREMAVKVKLGELPETPER